VSWHSQCGSVVFDSFQQCLASQCSRVITTYSSSLGKCRHFPFNIPCPRQLQLLMRNRLTLVSCRHSSSRSSVSWLLYNPSTFCIMNNILLIDLYPLLLAVRCRHYIICIECTAKYSHNSHCSQQIGSCTIWLMQHHLPLSHTKRVLKAIYDDQARHSQPPTSSKGHIRSAMKLWQRG
jgi:hypothetical protein